MKVIRVLVYEGSEDTLKIQCRQAGVPWIGANKKQWNSDLIIRSNVDLEGERILSLVKAQVETEQLYKLIAGLEEGKGDEK